MITLVCLVCLGLGLTAANAYSGRCQGVVIDRNGNPRANLQVTFAGTANYKVYTNSEGVFYLKNPANGSYKVTVAGQTLSVSITDNGLRPSTLVV